MASSLALKRLVSSNLVPRSMRLMHPATSASSATRLFNNSAIREYDDDDGEERGLDVHRRSGRSISRRRGDIFSGTLSSYSFFFFWSNSSMFSLFYLHFRCLVLLGDK